MHFKIKHDRVRSIVLHVSGFTQDHLFAVMNGMFSVLECLALSIENTLADEDETESEGYEIINPLLPPTFQAPHLRRLD